MIITSGGIGTNHELVRKELALPGWAHRPAHTLSGVPVQHVDGRMLGIAQNAGARRPLIPTGCGTIRRDQKLVAHMEQYSIRIPSGLPSLWFLRWKVNACPPTYPGFDTLGTLQHLMHTSYDYSWFILNQII